MNSPEKLERRRRERGEVTPDGNVGAGTSAAPAGNVGAGTSAPATTPSPGPIVSDDRDVEDKVGAGVTHSH